MAPARTHSPSTTLATIVAALVAACRPPARPAPRPAPHAIATPRAPQPSSGATEPPVAPYSLETLAPVFSTPVDSQSEIVVSEGALLESGWDGIALRHARDGARAWLYSAHAPFRAWIATMGVTVLVPMPGYVIANGRGSELARFEPGRASPVWVSAMCGELHGAQQAGELVVALCRTRTNQYRVLGVRASTGATVFDRPAPVSIRGADLVVTPGGDSVVRGEREMAGFDALGAERWRIDVGEGYGLARDGARVITAIHARGLIALDPATGREVQRWDDPTLTGTIDAFTSSLGSLRVVDGVAYALSGGVIRAIPLDARSTPWRAVGTHATIADDAVYACRAGRFVAIDRRDGSDRFSWSVGSCAIAGHVGTRVFVRAETFGPRVTGAELRDGSRLIAFDRQATARPCERARIEGTLRINGVPASGIAITAGASWSEHPDGSVTSWGGNLPPPGPLRSYLHAVTTTGPDGRYALTVCDRGAVPIVVDETAAARFANEHRATDNARYVHLVGTGLYRVDFEVVATGPEL